MTSHWVARLVEMTSQTSLQVDLQGWKTLHDVTNPTLVTFPLCHFAFGAAIHYYANLLNIVWPADLTVTIIQYDPIVLIWGPLSSGLAFLALRLEIWQLLLGSQLAQGISSLNLAPTGASVDFPISTRPYIIPSDRGRVEFSTTSKTPVKQAYQKSPG